MSELLSLLEVTTQGLFEALQQSAAWRTLHDSRRSMAAYAISLECLHKAQQQRDRALRGNPHWRLTQMAEARQLPALESDLALLGLPVNQEKTFVDSEDHAVVTAAAGIQEFVAAFYIDEQLRLLHDAMGSTIPQDWPRQYIAGSAQKYRWPQARDFLNHRLVTTVDVLEVAWLAQEHLVGMVEDASDIMADSRRHKPFSQLDRWQPHG